MSVRGKASRGIFHFKQGGRAGPLCFFLSMYSPRAHPGPPSPMDDEILIKPLSLWPEHSTGGLLILLKIRRLNAPIYAPQNTVLRPMHPNYSCFLWLHFVRLFYTEKPWNRCLCSDKELSQLNIISWQLVVHTLKNCPE